MRWLRSIALTLVSGLLAGPAVALYCHDFSVGAATACCEQAAAACGKARAAAESDDSCCRRAPSAKTADLTQRSSSREPVMLPAIVSPTVVVAAPAAPSMAVSAPAASFASGTPSPPAVLRV